MTNTTTVRDPWMLDASESKKIQQEVKGVGGGGIFCPKRNLSIKGTCHACNTVAKLFSSGLPEDREVAIEKMAKATFYMNAVIPSIDPNKSIILEMGKKAGNTILEGINLQGWVDIAHPIEGKGRELRALKHKGDMGFNAYTVSPILEKATWSIKEDILKTLPNLDNIIDILKTGSHEIYKISELEMNQSLIFRLCPPWENGAGNKRVMVVAWRHFGGITQEEVDGLIAVDTSKAAKATDAPAVAQTTLLDPTTPKPAPSTARTECFGMEAVYEVDSHICTACKDFVACTAAIPAI